MTTLSDYQYIALRRLKAGETVIQPGELVPLETSRLYGRGKVQALIQTGWIVPAGLAPEAKEAPKRKGGRRPAEPKEEASHDVDVRVEPDDLGAGRDKTADG